MMRLEQTGTPRFELITDGLWIVAWRGDHDVNMIRAGSDGVELPRTDFSVFCDGLFNDVPILLRERECRFLHLRRGHFVEECVR